jgi:hypothetical protein
LKSKAPGDPNPTLETSGNAISWFFKICFLMRQLVPLRQDGGARHDA